MSGQTYSTTIRLPSPEELAARLAARAIGDLRQASAEGFDAQTEMSPAQRRVQTLRLVTQSIATVGRPVSGSIRSVGTRRTRAVVALDGMRVPLEVTTAPDGETATVTLSFADVQGVSCAKERRLFGQITAALASEDLDPSTPTSQARGSFVEVDGHEQEQGS